MDRDTEEAILKRAVEQGLIDAGQLRELEAEALPEALAAGKWGPRIELLIRKGVIDEPTAAALVGNIPTVPPLPPGGRDLTSLPTLSPNQMLAGRFRVVRFIAQGGMG